jgi:hypothetical protein
MIECGLKTLFRPHNANSVFRHGRDKIGNEFLPGALVVR